jgi:endonuclease/exonuclease/phosphatase family metal-dependent hydrolase
VTPPSYTGPCKNADSELKVCSFNIQFLGTFKTRDNEGLARILREEGCDVAVIQELDAPPKETYLARNQLDPFLPYPEEVRLSKGFQDFAKKVIETRKKEDGDDPELDASLLRMWPIVSGAVAGVGQSQKPKTVPFPLDSAVDPTCLPTDLRPIEPSKASTDFFAAMERQGFGSFMMSNEDTGPTNYHTNGTASEWWVTFYNPKKVKPAADLPHGFLDKKRMANAVYKRVPFAFPFRTLDDKLDFVLISVHLEPGATGAAVRKRELAGIAGWIEANRGKEDDFLVLGDMNIESKAELDGDAKRASALPPGFVSLNSSALGTNAQLDPKKQRPYDHVVLNRKFTTNEEVPPGTFKVVDLAKAAEPHWKQFIANSTPVQSGQARIPAADEAYPGNPASFDALKFRTTYSDHFPVTFRMCSTETDSDG